jgi:hypothetical protein
MIFETIIMDALEFKRDTLISRLETRRMSKVIRASLETEVGEVEAALVSLGHPEPKGKRLNAKRMFGNVERKRRTDKCIKR